MVWLLCVATGDARRVLVASNCARISVDFPNLGNVVVCVRSTLGIVGLVGLSPPVVIVGIVAACPHLWL